MNKEEIIKKLNEAFLPQNQECDGAFCQGCWKDVIREAIKMIEQATAKQDVSLIDKVNIV